MLAADYNSPSSRRATQLGWACTLLFETERRRLSIAAAYLWLWPAIRLGQIAMVFGPEGRPLAYATWAYLTPEAGEAFVRNDPPFLELSDWNEGTELWILDFVAREGGAALLARKLREILAQRFSEAHAVKRSPPGWARERKRYRLPLRR